MRFNIIFKPSAEKSFAQLPTPEKRKIITAIEQLAGNPRPQGVKKLKSLLNLYRIRVGDYRVIYQIDEGVLNIVVVKIGHRKDIYHF